MRYALLTTAAAAALSLGIAQGIAQTSSSGGTTGQSGQTSGQTTQSNPTTSGQTQSGQTQSGQTTSGQTGQSNRGTAQTGQSNQGAGQTGQSNQGTAQTGNSGRANTGNSGNAANTGTSGGASATGSVGAVNVSSEQRTQITRAFSSVNVQPVTNVNFEVRTGVVLPATVSLHPCPRQVIDILTGIRECQFVIVKNEIVIVEPSSRRIVTVIERRG